MTRKKILLVDDSVTILMMEKFMLASGPWELLTATNGEAAIATTIAQRPDLILLDVVMPGMGGFEVLRALRSRPDTASTPIIMVTTRGEVTNVEAGWAGGCTDYVLKPVNSTELLTKVRSLLDAPIEVVA